MVPRRASWRGQLHEEGVWFFKLNSKPCCCVRRSLAQLARGMARAVVFGTAVFGLMGLDSVGRGFDFLHFPGYEKRYSCQFRMHIFLTKTVR